MTSSSDNPHGYEVGQRVLYRPPNTPLFLAEEGVVTKVGASFLYVRYGTDEHSKATLYEAVTPITEGTDNAN